MCVCMHARLFLGFMVLLELLRDVSPLFGNLLVFISSNALPLLCLLPCGLWLSKGLRKDRKSLPAHGSLPLFIFSILFSLWIVSSV